METIDGTLWWLENYEATHKTPPKQTEKKNPCVWKAAHHLQRETGKLQVNNNCIPSSKDAVCSTFTYPNEPDIMNGAFGNCEPSCYPKGATQMAATTLTVPGNVRLSVEHTDHFIVLTLKVLPVRRGRLGGRAIWKALVHLHSFGSNNLRARFRIIF